MGTVTQGEPGSDREPQNPSLQAPGASKSGSAPLAVLRPKSQDTELKAFPAVSSSGSAAPEPSSPMTSIASPALWVGFNVVVFFLLLADLFVFNRNAHEIRMREALGWSAFWIALSLAMNGLIYYWFGDGPALEFLTGYVIEKALSVDNLFVFLVLFTYFQVPKHLQHRVLFWGVFGALILRASFIVAGAALIQRFHPIIYFFGAFLVFTGFKLLFQKEENMDPEQNRVLILLRRWVPAVSTYRGTAFFVREGGKRLATPLFFVLVVVEFTDIVFAVDSIPAIFGVTDDPFIVYSSNICAVLGLRALFFALAAVMDRFHYLKIGLALVLIFVGVKMAIADFFHIPIGASLLAILFLLTGAVALSLLRPLPPGEPE